MQRRRQPSPIFSLSQLPTYASRSVEYIDRLASQSRIFMSSIWKGGKGLKTEQADLFEESYSKKDDRLPVLEVERSRGEKCLHIKFMILDQRTFPQQRGPLSGRKRRHLSSSPERYLSFLIRISGLRRYDPPTMRSKAPAIGNG